MTRADWEDTLGALIGFTVGASIILATCAFVTAPFWVPLWMIALR